MEFLFNYPTENNPLSGHFVGDQCRIKREYKFIPFSGIYYSIKDYNNERGLSEAIDRYGRLSYPYFLWKMWLSKIKLSQTRIPSYREIFRLINSETQSESVDLMQQYPLDTKLLLTGQKDTVKMAMMSITDEDNKPRFIPIDHNVNNAETRVGIIISAPRGREKALISYTLLSGLGSITGKPKIELSPLVLGTWQHEVILENYGVIVNLNNTFHRYNKVKVLND